MRRNPAVFAILVGGLIAATLDITYAISFSAWRGVPPMRLLQSVASGLLGSASYEGGTATAVLGLILHYLMALLIAAIFYFASRRLTFLTRNPITWGALYGIVVYAVMNLVVIPLSAFPHQLKFVPIVVTTGLLVHMFCIGVPISLATRHASLTSPA